MDEDSAGLIEGADGRTRCLWPGADELYLAYHDHEWGRPVDDDTRLFEKMCLEGFQSGLSWLIILRKRENFRRAFAGFDIEKVAAYTDADVQRLLTDEGIVRNRAKIEATVANARAAVDLGSPDDLSELLWSFAPPSRPRPADLSEIASASVESKAMARELKR